jgi:hypothetical protein
MGHSPNESSRFLPKGCLTRRVQHWRLAASSGGERIDDFLYCCIGTMVGHFKAAIGSMLGIRLMMEAAVGEGSAQAFVKKQEQEEPPLCLLRLGDRHSVIRHAQAGHGP